MRKAVICILLLLLCGSGIAQKKGRPAATRKTPIALKPYKFNPDEQLNYSILWNNVKAAKMTLTAMSNGEHGRLVELELQTIGVARELVKINDRFVAHLDESLFPVRTQWRIEEGLRKEAGEAVYDRKAGAVTIGEQSYAIASTAHDLASVFWALRAVKSGASTVIDVFSPIEKRSYKIEVEAVGRSELQAASGPVPTVELAVRMRMAEPDKYSVRLWITDDEQRLPLVIKARPPFGEITMQLADSMPQQELN
ncbi:MAG: DUF3108 domain-containing protein [Acidobacteriota bacterium]|nr:DUF3108 domain-containing protein [Blastocatellia bacterium]MDW8411143.1 DUF3108 domain-containing protein [Acidobacteriota bacterium]